MLGSSNLTSAALTINKEWNTFVEEDNELCSSILEEFHTLWNMSEDYASVKDKYKVEFLNNKQQIPKTIDNITDKISPNEMQQSFIENFKSYENKIIEDYLCLLLVLVRHLQQLLR